MNSVLVIQLKRLGDVVLTTPALGELRKLYPKAHITLLLDHHSAAIGPAVADVDEVWIYDRKASFGLWFNLIRSGFDLCLDFTGNDRSAVISFLSKAAQRIGFSFIAKRAARSWGYTRLVQSPVREKHTVDHYLDLVRFLGDPKDPISVSDVSLRLAESVIRSAETLRREIGVSGPYFVIHPGAARPEKYWLADRWASVIRHAQTRFHFACLVTGGRDPEELRHVDEILARCAESPNIFNLAGKLDFLLSAAIIREGAFFAGVDTAAAHVASAFQRPELVLFGPTNPFHWHPGHPFGIVVRAGFAHPLDHFEPRQRGYPMSELSTQTVICGMEAVFKFLE